MPTSSNLPSGMQQLATLGSSLMSKGVSRGTDLVFSHGIGAFIYTVDGTKYLDYTCGIGVTNVGHCHPKVVSSAQNQLGKLFHGQVNIGHQLPHIEFLNKLKSIMPSPKLDTFLFANSGSEALENCVKIARRASGRQNIIVMQGAFHGRTYAAMSLTNSKQVYSQGFGPLVPGIYTAPFPYFHRGEGPSNHVINNALHGLEVLLKQRTNPKDTAAIIIEPILGEGGYVPAASEYLRGVREICDRYGILLIIDEVQSGFGRTGAWFAISESGVEPDIMSVAKGIANGLPLSVVCGRSEIMNACTPGSLGGTYTGNVVAVAAASAVIDVIKEEKVLENTRERSKQLIDGLTDYVEKYGLTLRGRGLMLALEFPTEFSLKDELVLDPIYQEKHKPKHIYDSGIAHRIVKRLEQDSNILVLTTSIFDTIRIVPPLTTTKEEMDIFINSLKKAFEKELI